MEGNPEMFTWDDLDYWKCGEWDVVQERLEDITKAGGIYCPGKKNLFKALKLVAFEEVRVMMVAQDPYPNPGFAMGPAFSINKDEEFTPTLVNLLKEYRDDTHHEYPDDGDLTPWCSEGVLLWNAIPSCAAWKSMSHDWPEWHLLTKEIIERLSQSGRTVFIFFGGVARGFAKYVEPGEDMIEVSHPSPRASRMSKDHPFFGSRIFTRTNTLLVEQGLEPINWKL